MKLHFYKYQGAGNEIANATDREHPERAQAVDEYTAGERAADLDECGDANHEADLGIRSAGASERERDRRREAVQAGLDKK